MNGLIRIYVDRMKFIIYEILRKSFWDVKENYYGCFFDYFS